MKKTTSFAALAVMALALSCGSAAVAAPKVPDIAKMASSVVKTATTKTVISANIYGYDTVDYLFDAPAGAKVSVNVKPASAEVALVDPQEIAVYDPSPVTLPVKGRWTLRAGLTRNAARDHMTTPVKIEMTVTVVR